MNEIKELTDATVEERDEAFAEHVAEPQERQGLFVTLTFVWVLFMALGLVFSMLTWNQEVTVATDVSVSVGQLLLGAILIWTVSSIKVLQADELGAVLMYGLPMIKIRRGPKFLVTGLFQLERFMATVAQNQFPDEPELIQKTDDKTPLEIVEVTAPDGSVTKRSKVRPIRITTAKPRADAPDDILNVQMIVEFTFWVRWIVVNPFLFIVNAGGSIDNVVKQMRDVGESCLNSEVTKQTPSQLITGFEKLQKKLQEELKKSVERWGVRVENVGMTAPDLNHEVAMALRDIPKAKAEAVQVRVRAEAEEYRLAQEGKGRGKAREEELAGEGRGYKRAGKFIGVEPQEVLAAQVARETVGQGDLVLGAEGIAQAVGLGRAILKQKPKPQTKESEK